MTRIGAKFLESRLGKRLTLDEVSESTKIRKEFLDAIEKGEYKKLPSSAYAYGFVKNYAKFLGLNEEQSIALFKREFDPEKAFEVLPKSFSKIDEYKTKRFRLGRNLLLVVGIFSILVAFIFIQFRNVIFNPPLNIYSPKDNAIVTSSVLDVKGSTDSNSSVYVEGELVSIDSSGNFEKIITIFPGKTTISIKSINRFGKQSVIERHIEVKPGY